MNRMRLIDGMMVLTSSVFGLFVGSTVLASPITITIADSVVGTGSSPLAINLTDTGTLDWRDWGTADWSSDMLPGVVKNGSSGIISALARSTSSDMGTAGDSFIATSWSDGTPIGTATDNRNFSFLPYKFGSESRSFRFTITAGQGRVYVLTTGWNAYSLLSVEAGANLESLAFNGTDTATNFSGGNPMFGVVWRVDYEYYGGPLILTYTFDSNMPQPNTEWSNLSIKGAAVVPEPTSLVLLGLGGLTMLRRRSSVSCRSL